MKNRAAALAVIFVALLVILHIFPEAAFARGRGRSFSGGGGINILWVLGALALFTEEGRAFIVALLVLSVPGLVAAIIAAYYFEIEAWSGAWWIAVILGITANFYIVHKAFIYFMPPR